jgi:biotin carboxyl carrier protein
VRIEIAVGDAVVAGQPVLVVEAMKMENALKAPSDGVVVRIEAIAGQAVEKGAVLVVLE